MGDTFPFEHLKGFQKQPKNVFGNPHQGGVLSKYSQASKWY